MWMSRLENEMMAQPDIRQLLDARAATIRRLDTGNSLATFFYASLSGEERSKIAHRTADYVGVFEVFRHDRADVRAKRSGQPLKRKYRSFLRLTCPDDQPFLLVQEYTSQSDNDKQTYVLRRGGFAFIAVGNSLIRFTASHSNPRDRAVEVYYPIDDNQASYWRLEREQASDRLFYNHFIPVTRALEPLSKALSWNFTEATY